MVKIVLILLILLVGCESKEPDHVVSNQDNDIAHEIVGRYEANQSSKEDDLDNTITSRGYVYSTPRDIFKTLNWDYFVEGNECIYADYIIGIICAFDEDTGVYSVEIGSNCYDRSRQGPAVKLNVKDIPIKDDVQLQVHDLVKIYYEFPEGYEATDYIDHLNYATTIEKIQ